MKMNIRIANEQNIKGIKKLYPLLFEAMEEIQPMFRKRTEQDKKFSENIIGAGN